MKKFILMLVILACSLLIGCFGGSGGGFSNPMMASIDPVPETKPIPDPIPNPRPTPPITANTNDTPHEETEGVETATTETATCSVAIKVTGITPDTTTEAITTGVVKIDPEKPYFTVPVNTGNGKTTKVTFRIVLPANGGRK